MVLLRNSLMWPVKRVMGCASCENQSTSPIKTSVSCRERVALVVAHQSLSVVFFDFLAPKFHVMCSVQKVIPRISPFLLSSKALMHPGSSTVSPTADAGMEVLGNTK